MSKKILSLASAVMAFAVLPPYAGTSPPTKKTDDYEVDDLTTNWSAMGYLKTISGEFTLEGTEINTREVTVQCTSTTKAKSGINNYGIDNQSQSNEVNGTYETNELKACLI
jgi:hypothetical protein